MNEISCGSFSSTSHYYHTCKKLKKIPISFRFELKDLTFFHAIFYNDSAVQFPAYLNQFQGSALRNCHLDHLSMCSIVYPRIPQNLELENPTTGITKSFFYRAHMSWNRLPLSLRQIESAKMFKKHLADYLWKDVLSLANLPSDLLEELND